MDQFPDKGKPQTRRILGSFRLGVSGIEPIEDVGQIGLGDARAVVLDRHHGLLSGSVGLGTNDHGDRG